MKTFGDFAKERIKGLAKSQKDLAQKLNVSPAYISQILTGKSPVVVAIAGSVVMIALFASLQVTRGD